MVVSFAAALASQPWRGRSPQVDPDSLRSKEVQGLLTQDTETEEVLLDPSRTSEPGWVTVAVWPSMRTMGGSGVLMVSLTFPLDFLEV